MATLKLEKINKIFDKKTHVIHDVDLEVQDGEFCVFVGPSGCGKSTLLRLIAGLEDITSGEFFIGDKLMNDVQPSDRGIGMVFQSYALYPHMTVRDNMAFGLKLAKKSKTEIAQRIEETAKSLQLEDLLDRKPKELSGGQRQRVAIGRSLTRRPEVFLFDEPLSNLDASLRVHMRVELAQLHKELESTIVYVTHDQVEAMTLADKIVVLKLGHVMQVGTPLELYYHPKNLFVGSFIGSPKMNFLDGTVLNSTDKTVEVKLKNDQTAIVPCVGTTVKAGDDIVVGIRPEHVRLAVEGSGNPQIAGSALVVEHLGETSYIHFNTPLAKGEGFIIKTVSTIDTQYGDKIKIEFNPSDMYLFNKKTEDALERLNVNIAPLTQQIERFAKRQG